jgi:hypothetical protein
VKRADFIVYEDWPQRSERRREKWSTHPTPNKMQASAAMMTPAAKRRFCGFFAME